VLRVGDLLRGRSADLLGRADSALAEGGRYEILWVVALDQRGEIRGEGVDLDLCARWGIAPDQVEEKRDADIVDVLEPRGIDDDPAVRIAGKGLERCVPDRGGRVRRDAPLQHLARDIAGALRRSYPSCHPFARCAELLACF